MDAKEQIKQKQEQKLKFEIEYISSQLLNTMSYLDLADDDRTRELYGQLDSAYAKTLRVLEQFKSNP